MPRTETAPPRVVISGAGLHYPYQATLEVLKAMRDCDVIFSNLAGAESMEFLRLFCDDVRALSYEGYQAGHWSKMIIDEAKPGKTVGFITRGHPFVAGALARKIYRDAEKIGAQIDSYGAISSFDTMVSLGSELGHIDWDAVHYYTYDVFTDHDCPVIPQIPKFLTLPCIAETREAETKKFCGILADAYSPKHKAYLYGPRYEVRKMEEIRLKDLEKKIMSYDPHLAASVLLFVPPVKR